MRIAYIDCRSGISGDMTLGALIDAGVDLGDLEGQLATLGVSGWRLEKKTVKRHQIAGTKVDVVLDGDDGVHRHLSHVVTAIGESDLSQPVKERSVAVFTRLAEAEAAVHDTTPEKVHFHEVGAVDAIVDVVGACLGFEMLGIERVYCSSFRVGRGTVTAAHGMMPVPAPGTLELLKGFPVEHTDIEAELVTPTGAAILTTIGDEFSRPPTFVPDRVGYGAGGRDLSEIANLLRIEIGETLVHAGHDHSVLIETNIDDMNPEVYGYLIQTLLDAGAKDAFLTPVIMKKTRPGILLTVLVGEQTQDAVIDTIFRETTTLGVRLSEVGRVVVERTHSAAQTEWGEVRTKVANWNGRVRVTPEYADCAMIAAENGVPILEVYDAVRRTVDNAENQ